MSICEYLGIELEYIVWGLTGVSLLLFIMLIINMVTVNKVKKKYKKFMSDADGRSLEEKINDRLKQINTIEEMNIENRSKIEKIEKQMNSTFQKVGLVKYDALNEMGGKLSFSLALLTENNDGFIINAMHTREGCYTYIKEVIAGKPVPILGNEEREALDMAINYR